MFTIIGGDGKEYGPVTAEQLHVWLAQGRANLETKARALGSEEWRRLGDYAEFGTGATFTPPPSAATPADAAPTGAGAASTPAAVPAFQPAGAVSPEAFAKSAIARAAPLDVMGCVERGWELYKANFGSLFLVTLLIILFEFCLSRLIGLAPGPTWQVTSRIKIGMDTWASALLSAPIYGAMNIYYLRKMRGHVVDVGDVFRAMGEFFVPLFLVGLVGGLLIAFGCVFLILPGIYLAVAYSFARLLVIDHRMSFWTALEVSRQVVSSQWFRVFGLWLLAGFVALLGLLGLIIGIFFTVPIFFASAICAYEDLFNPPSR